MDEKLTREIIEYAEGMAEQWDAEYGANRKFYEILQDDCIYLIPFHIKEND